MSTTLHTSVLYVQGFYSHVLSSLLQVRDKMLYAATKATVKREFQSDVVADEVAATSKVGVWKGCGRGRVWKGRGVGGDVATTCTVLE